jgi:DNA modification methylase
MAKLLNRRYVGIEVNPEYIKIINARLAQETLKI